MNAVADKRKIWVLCESKSFPGKHYFYNVVTGETFWSSNTEAKNKHMNEDDPNKVIPNTNDLKLSVQPPIQAQQLAATSSDLSLENSNAYILMPLKIATGLFVHIETSIQHKESDKLETKYCVQVSTQQPLSKETLNHEVPINETKKLEANDLRLLLSGKKRKSDMVSEKKDASGKVTEEVPKKKVTFDLSHKHSDEYTEDRNILKNDDSNKQLSKLPFDIKNLKITVNNDSTKKVELMNSKNDSIAPKTNTKDKIGSEQTKETQMYNSKGYSPVDNITGCSPIHNTTGYTPVDHTTGYSPVDNTTGYSPVDNTTVCSTDDNTTGCSQIDNTTGYSPVDNTTGYSPVDNTTGYSLIDKTTGYSPVDNTSRYSPVDNTSRYSPVDNTTGYSLIDKTTGYSPVDNTTRYSPVDNTTGYSPVDNTTGYSPIDDMTRYSPIDNTTGCSQIDNTTGYSLIDNMTGYSPVNNTTGYFTVDNTTGYSPIDNTTGYSLNDNTTGYSSVDNTTEYSTVDNTTRCSSSDNTTGCSPINNKTESTPIDNTTGYSPIDNTGYSKVDNTGYSKVDNTGYSKVDNTTGYSTVDNTTGCSPIDNTGYSKADNTGYSKVDNTTGYSTVDNTSGCSQIGNTVYSKVDNTTRCSTVDNPTRCSPTDNLEEFLKQFYLKNAFIDKKLKENSEEWICAVRQILEECLSDYLQNTSKIKKPPVTLYESLQIIRKMYETHTSIVEVIDEMFGVIYNTGLVKDKIKPSFSPQEMLKIIGCGLFLISALKDKNTVFQLEDAEQSLMYLIELIEQADNEDDDISILKMGTTIQTMDYYEDRTIFVKPRSDITQYLKRHYPEWKTYDETQDNLGKPKVLRTYGKNVNLIRLNKAKNLEVVADKTVPIAKQSCIDTNNSEIEKVKINLDNKTTDCNTNNNNSDIDLKCVYARPKVESFFKELSKTFKVTHEFIENCRKQIHKDTNKSVLNNIGIRAAKVHSSILSIICKLKLIIDRETNGDDECLINLLKKAGEDITDIRFVRYKHEITKVMETAKSFENALQIIKNLCVGENNMNFVNLLENRSKFRSGR